MAKDKKESVWTQGINGPMPPFPFQVWTTKKKSSVMYGFDEQHIRDMMDPIKIIKIKKLKEKEEKIESEHLGPPGAEIGRPAEYEPAFKILKEWVDMQGGPSEKVRKKIREHWIEYDKIKKKK